jgi:O-6-methylguanine DNA methyltransferase
MDAANFRFITPQGPVYGYIAETGLQTLLLPHPDRPFRPHLLHSAPNKVVGHALRSLLERYFQGLPVDFAEIPLDFSRGTAFQQSVWGAAQAVGWGQTATYADLARALGREKSSARAIGAALGANPLHVVVPCHRYLAANGGLVDFAAGLAWKSRLLELEGALLA